MLTYTRAEIVKYLADRCKRGAFIATLLAETEPDLRAKSADGTPNPFKGNVLKAASVNGILHWSYEGSVNRQREREEKVADFEAMPRKWGKRIPKSCFVVHGDALYLELKVQRSLGHRYFRADNGSPITDAEIEPFLRPTKPGRQEVENEVILRDYRIDNIKVITVDGGDFHLVEVPSTEVLIATKVLYPEAFAQVAPG